MIFHVGFTVFRTDRKGDIKISQIKREAIPDKFSIIDNQMVVKTSRRKINKGVWSHDTRYFYYVNTDLYEDISQMLIFDIIKPLLREAKINDILKD